MGKQKLNQLLDKLQDNRSQDIQNAAAIFTVAQGALNQLSDTTKGTDKTMSVGQLSSPAPLLLTKADMLARYGSYNACRTAAKQAGITFSRTPRWQQLVAAFSYLTSCQTCVNTYLQQYPNSDLAGTKVTLQLGA